MRRVDTATFADELLALVEATPAGERRIVAVAGAPGSGKSTLVETLETRLSTAHPGSVAVLPMDGYHYDDEVLVPRGWRARKGAPHTFDVGGLRAMLERLRRNDEEFVAVPRFDRGLEVARAGARLIDRSVRLVLTEGNYLLLDEAPWASLAPLYDLTAMIRVEESELRRRLTDRWVGFGLDPAAIAAKLDDNDLPNGRHILARSSVAEFEIVQLASPPAAILGLP